MKNSLAAVSVIGLLGASGLVAWSVLSRPDATLITSEQANSFDLKIVSPQERPMAAHVPVEEMRDAVASPVSPRPIAMDGMLVPAAAPVPPSKPAFRSFLTPRLESGVLKSRFFAAMLGAPARFLAGSGPLKSPRAFRAFLDDKGAVDGYLNSTVVRVVLNSPAAAKAVLESPSLVKAFLGSPALRDPGVVRALVTSPMVLKMLDCPGVQEALADPAVIRSMTADPETLRWLGENPDAVRAMGSIAPALAGSLRASGR
ncbi:MAG: hypothetical protein KGJ84_10585 [Elusimicrobia bacterium]|nr:hypothetical protein [Elusimicrobiota bacterium]